MNKKIIFPIVALTVFGSVVYGGAAVSAHGLGSGKDEIVNKLATKLGVEDTKVQSAFDDISTERKAEMNARYASNLDQLVTDGKITAEQKAAIVAKREELLRRRESERAELEKWASDNGINLSIVGPMGMGHSMKGMEHFKRAL